ncbi:MAG TPA: RNA polymerase sigma factor FliA [Polyangiaceae bacterium]|jgi:RNA polymerase sigma factor for flagellar operon FliA
MTIAVIAEAESRARRSMDRTAYERFLPLVRRTAMRLARRVPSSITVADLVGYGWVGLMEAYQRSAANMREEEFEAYALYRVRGAMLDYLRSLDPATRDLRRASRRVARAIRELSQKLSREPEEEEIAESMGMQLKNYRELLEKIAAAGMARLELLDLDDVELEQNGENVDDAVAKRRLADAVVVAMETLPPKLVQVLALYYQEGCTLRQIGAVLGVGESRVSQLHSEAIHRLRAAVGRE